MMQGSAFSLTPANFGYQFGVFASAVATMPALVGSRMAILNPDPNFTLATQRSLISFDASASNAAKIHRTMELQGLAQRYDMFVKEAGDLHALLERSPGSEIESDFARWVESSGAAGVPIRDSRAVPLEVGAMTIRKIARIMARRRDHALAAHVWTLGRAYAKLAEKAPEWKGEPLVYASDYCFQAGALFAMLIDDRAMIRAADLFLRSAGLLMEQSEPLKAAFVSDLAIETAERVNGPSPTRGPAGSAVARIWLDAARRLEKIDSKGFVVSISRGIDRAAGAGDRGMLEGLLGAASLFYSERGAFVEAADSYVRMAAMKLMDEEMSSESWAALSAYLAMAKEQAARALRGKPSFDAGQAGWLHQQAQRLAGSARFSIVEGVASGREP